MINEEIEETQEVEAIEEIEVIEEVEEKKPFDLVRNQYGGIDATIEHPRYGLVPTTLENELLERAENGEFGEIQ